VSGIGQLKKDTKFGLILSYLQTVSFEDIDINLIHSDKYREHIYLKVKVNQFSFYKNFFGVEKYG